MKTPYILEVEEPVISWHEIEGTSIVDIAIKPFEEDVLNLKKGHYYSFLKKDGGKNPQAFRSWKSQARLKKTERLLGRQPKLSNVSYSFSSFF